MRQCQTCSCLATGSGVLGFWRRWGGGVQSLTHLHPTGSNLSRPRWLKASRRSSRFHSGYECIWALHCSDYTASFQRAESSINTAATLLRHLAGVVKANQVPRRSALGSGLQVGSCAPTQHTWPGDSSSHSHFVVGENHGLTHQSATGIRTQLWDTGPETRVSEC